MRVATKIELDTQTQRELRIAGRAAPKSHCPIGWLLFCAQGILPVALNLPWLARAEASIILSSSDEDGVAAGCCAPPAMATSSVNFERLPLPLAWPNW